MKNGYKCHLVIARLIAAKKKSQKLEGVSTIPSWLDVIPMHIFEEVSTLADPATQAFFMEYFEESRNQSTEFFSILPCLRSGVELAPIKCFRYNHNMYSMIETGMPRSVLEKIIEICQKSDITKFYVALFRDLPNFTNAFKILALVGFKQVLPEFQQQICSASAVLMELDID